VPALTLRNAHVQALHPVESGVRASRIRANVGSTGVFTPERLRRMPLWEAAEAA
jgi:hypothetical protein